MPGGTDFKGHSRIQEIHKAGSFSKQDKAKLISRHPAQPIPRWRQGQRDQWLFPSPRALQVCTNDLSKGCGCKLLKQMQSSDNCKELVSRAKKNYKTPVFQKNKSVQLACEKDNEMPVSRADGERLEDSCPDKTLGGGLVLLLSLPRKDAKRPVSPQLFVGRGIAEVPWAGWVRQCLSAASSSRLQGGSFHHLLCQEVTHLSTGTFKLSSTQ